MTTAFKPLKDRILIELSPVVEKVSAGGIIMNTKTRESYALVVSVGSDVVEVKAGDKILYDLGKFQKIDIDKEKEYAVIFEADIIGVYEDDAN